jgi:hypothetical protein
MATALLAAWLAIQYDWVHRRRQFLLEQQSAEWPHRVGFIYSAGSPWVLRMFCEPAVGMLFIPRDSAPGLVARVRRLFPEASLGTGYVESPDWWPRPVCVFEQFHDDPAEFQQP